MMSIEERVKRIIKEGLGLNVYSNEDKFADDLGCDSLDMLDIELECEKEFVTPIPRNDLQKIITVQDLIDYIKEHGR